MNKHDLSRDRPQFFNIFERSTGPIEDVRLLDGCEGALINWSPTTDASTHLVHIEPGWRATDDAEDATIELFVLKGDLSIDGERVASSGYGCIPQGLGSAELASEQGALALLYWSPGLIRFPTPFTERRIVRAWEEPWKNMWFEEDEPAPSFHGGYQKSLRLPDFAGEFHGGPGGMLRMSYMMPDYRDTRHHAHDDSWEGIVCLAGDVFMPGRGRLAHGTFLGNPQHSWHAPMISQGGALMVYETDAPQGPWNVREYPDGERLADQYFDTEPLSKPQPHTPWSELAAAFGAPQPPASSNGEVPVGPEDWSDAETQVKLLPRGTRSVSTARQM